MAELAVATSFGLIQIIMPLLSKLDLPAGVTEEDIRSMKSWLSSMQAFMEDNYERQGSSKTRLDLIDKVGKIAYDIEDVVDDFILHSPPYTFHRYRATRQIHSLAHRIHHRNPLHGVSKKIASIRNEILDIMSQNCIFGDRSSNPRAGPSTTNRVSPLLLDDEMVGYEQQKKESMRRLAGGEKSLVKLSVDGPAGSGKTTLVKNIFWKPRIQAQFDCHAWVSVSQHPDVEKISKNLLHQLCSSRKEAYPADDGSTSQTLRRYLTGKRYLVVLDDIWKPEDWSDFKDALPNSYCGSRIILTTRNSNILSISASLSPHDHICRLNCLESLDAWKLFCRKAFPKGECPSELKDISKLILTRCEGLPLAIVAVAGALAQKPQTPYEWEKFHTNFGSEIWSSSDLSLVNKALLRSYMDLSSSLKCCFLYMSIFPEDHSVERGRLIRLWVAERFAVATEYQTAEEVAEDYLNELIQRNLIHVSNWDFDGRPRNCRPLNLILKFIIQKSKDENFASVFPKENTTHNQLIQNQSKQIRRLSVHDHCKHLPANGDFSTVRSMFLLRLHEINPSDFENNLLKLKLIKVIDVQGAPLTKFPKEIAPFTLMRYLSFRDTKIKDIPSSIEKLSYLETLDLKQTDVTELPHQISNLQNLCHLFVYKYDVIKYVTFDSVQAVKLHKGIGKLTNLQNLSLVKIDQKGRILKDLKALSQLRKLGLTGLKTEHCNDLCAAVEAMKSLKTLDVTSAAKEEYIELEEMVKDPPKTLQRLYLKGRLRKIPTWVSELDYLVRIGLKWSKLSDSPLETLKHLPNLTELQLVDCFTGEELIFEASGFKKLEIVLIEDLSDVKMIKIENGAMPELKQMSLRRCPLLTMLLGVEGLMKVEELTLYDMATELVARLSINGEDRDEVKHVPLIHSFTLRTQNQNQYWSLHNLSDSVSLSH